MTIGVVGASGLVGTAVRAALEKHGHEWIGFSRTPKGKEGEWRSLEEGFAGVDAVVNVAGESIAKRWSDQSKKLFHQSRVGLTEFIVKSLKGMAKDERPKVLINASAVGYYGDQGASVLTEASELGKGYLADLCEEWEAVAEKAQSLGVRVVLGRIGVVLGEDSEAWKKMKMGFSLGMGGRLGDGEQFWPVVHLDDVAGGILHCLDQDYIHGPVNLVGPTTVTNAVFTDTLGAVLKRPTVLTVPAFVLKVVFGDFADALLASYRVEPTILEKSGYNFLHPDLAGLLVSLKG